MTDSVNYLSSLFYIKSSEKSPSFSLLIGVQLMGIIDKIGTSRD
ncbi:MAG: hypothetical protein PHU72_02325 [Dethiosulfovibrio sp.]|nr:hypothetical protein [Dethiosulfovibrio sp.]